MAWSRSWLVSSNQQFDHRTDKLACELFENMTPARSTFPCFCPALTFVLFIKKTNLCNNLKFVFLAFFLNKKTEGKNKVRGF